MSKETNNNNKSGQWDTDLAQLNKRCVKIVSIPQFLPTFNNLSQIHRTY